VKDEAEPVSPDERVVRLIWREFLRPGEIVPIQPVAFKPRANEPEGISVFRLECMKDPTEALAVMVPAKRGGYAIAVLAVAELLALGLSVKPAKIDEVPGHALIPELSIAAVQATDANWKAVRIALAQLGSKNLIPPADGNS